MLNLAKVLSWLCQEGFMIKKLMFVLLVMVLLTAGTVFSMADDPVNPSDNKSGWSDMPVTNNTDEGLYIDEYSSETVIDQYSGVFFDEESQAGGVYLAEGEIKLVKDEDSTNIQDYKLTATMMDTVELSDGDSIIVMIFVKTEDTYKLLTIPKNLTSTWLRWYKIRLPYTGKDNPNHVRVVAFQKSQWKSLELGVNLEVTDLSEIIENGNKNFNFRGSLKNCNDTIKQVGNILH